MSDEKLIIGMPAGSLADPGRGGNLVDLLRAAGFATKGYDAGGPTSFPLNAVLLGWDGRPQEFGAQLALGEIDIAIAGDDWVRERLLEYKYEYDQTVELDKVLSLRRGNVRIVAICRPLEGVSFDDWLKTQLEAKAVITMVSEMPYLAAEWWEKKVQTLGFGDTHRAFSVQKFKTPPKIDAGLVVYETWGKTEAKVLHESVDLGLEITQTGSAIRNYGLVIAEEIMASETGIWANPAVKKNAAKYDLARMVLLNLYGAVYAENKVMIFFNVKRDATELVLDYLEANSLFADEPTMNTGENYVEFSIQLDTDRADLPVAQVRYELAKLGATGIETVPLDSSIPGLHRLDF